MQLLYFMDSMRKHLFLFAIIVGGCAAMVPAAGLSVGSSVDEVLDAMDQRGKDLKSLSADISMAEIDPNLGDVGTVRTGKLYYQDLGQSIARFRVLFDKKISGKTSEIQKHDYVYADGKLTDRDYERHQQNTRQVLKPGEKMQLFKLDGPFPLPLGQDKADVHKMFETIKKPTASDDPVGTIHLQLLPHAGTEISKQFKTIDLWIDPKTDFPVRVATLDTNETTLKPHGFIECEGQRIDEGFGFRDGPRRSFAGLECEE